MTERSNLVASLCLATLFALEATAATYLYLNLGYAAGVDPLIRALMFASVAILWGATLFASWRGEPSKLTALAGLATVLTLAWDILRKSLWSSTPGAADIVEVLVALGLVMVVARWHNQLNKPMQTDAVSRRG